MIVYEVNLRIQPSVLDEYRAWLDVHVREILDLPGFSGATVFDVLEPTDAPVPRDPANEATPQESWPRLCVQYRLRDEAALADYLREHAPRLRADGMAKFGGRFTAERRVMRVIRDLGRGPAAS